MQYRHQRLVSRVDDKGAAFVISGLLTAKKKLEVHLFVRKSEKLKPLAYASWNLEETEFEAVL